MRPANIVAVVRRRRATVILAVAAALVAAATALGATAALPPYKLVLDYQAYVGGKGKAKAEPGARHDRLHQRPGRPAELQLPAGDERHQRRREDGERRARRHSRASAQAQRVLLGPGGGGRRPLRPADGQRQGEGDHLRLRHGRQPVDLRDGQGHGSRSSASSPPTRPTRRRRTPIFLNGSQTSVLGAFGTYTQRFHKNVKTAAIVYPNDPGAITAAAAFRKGMQQVGRKVTMIAVPPLATDLIGAATQASSADMIVAALGFTDVRAVREGDRPDRLHEADPLDADLHVHSAGRRTRAGTSRSGPTASRRRS